MNDKLQVEQMLKNKNISYRLIPLSQPARSVEDVMRYAEKPIVMGEICKTLIVKGRKTSTLQAIFLQGKDMIDFKKLKNIFGEATEMGNFDDVIKASHVEPGAVCPFLLNVPLLVDRNVLTLERVNCGSGSLLYGLEFFIQDLEKVKEYKIEDLVK